MRRVRFTAPLLPIAKGRPRVGKRRIYTPEKTAGYERDLAMVAAAHAPVAPFQGPLRVVLTFGLPDLKRRGAHIVKPDVDNLAKAVLDALNGWFWKDDAQIAELLATKSWVEKPFVTIEVEEVASA